MSTFEKAPVTAIDPKSYSFYRFLSIENAIILQLHLYTFWNGDENKL